MCDNKKKYYWVEKINSEGYYWKIDCADDNPEACLIECKIISGVLQGRHIDRSNWWPVNNLDGYLYNGPIQKPIVNDVKSITKDFKTLKEPSLSLDKVWLEAVKANILAHESVAAVSNADDIVKAYIERFCKEDDNA